VKIVTPSGFFFNGTPTTERESLLRTAAAVKARICGRCTRGAARMAVRSSIGQSLDAMMPLWKLNGKSWGIW